MASNVVESLQDKDLIKLYDRLKEHEMKLKQEQIKKYYESCQQRKDEFSESYKIPFLIGLVLLTTLVIVVYYIGTSNTPFYLGLSIFIMIFINFGMCTAYFQIHCCG